MTIYRDQIARVIDRTIRGRDGWTPSAIAQALLDSGLMKRPLSEDETIADAAQFIREHYGIAGDGTNDDPDVETAASICTRLDRLTREGT